MIFCIHPWFILAFPPEPYGSFCRWWSTEGWAVADLDYYFIYWVKQLKYALKYDLKTSRIISNHLHSAVFFLRWSTLKCIYRFCGIIDKNKKNWPCFYVVMYHETYSLVKGYYPGAINLATKKELYSSSNSFQTLQKCKVWTFTTSSEEYCHVM